MRKPTAVLALDVAGDELQAAGLERFGDAKVLLRCADRPLAWVEVPIVGGQLDAASLGRSLLKHRRALAAAVVRRLLEDPNGLSTIDQPPGRSIAMGPAVTVAVCTRDCASDLTACLDAIAALEYPQLDRLVIDNAPSDQRTETLVRDRYPSIRYVCEPRPGLDWARNRAVFEARGDIVAFTDDDVIVDPDWVGALAAVFRADPSAMAVTGLVIPDELETEAQRLFEAYGGFGRGFVRRWYRAPAGRSLAMIHGGTGKFGTGANMAFRRSLFDSIGGFDPALDVGTVTNGGGDLDMFFRVLKAGSTLVYEPAAIVRHRHRRSYAALRTQIANNGVGFYSYLCRSVSAWPDERWAFIRLGLWWYWWWHARRLVKSVLGKERIPRDLIWAELRGTLAGLRRYKHAAKRAAEIMAEHSAEPQLPPRNISPTRPRRRAEAIRAIDIAEPLVPISDAEDYERLRVIVSRAGKALGSAALEHHGAIVPPAWLADAIATQLAGEILQTERLDSRVLAKTFADRIEQRGARRRSAEASRFIRSAEASRSIGAKPTVSIVVATRDRAADLRRCLESLVAQRAQPSIEIIVVDNNPDSGVTGSVVRDFPGVVLVSERRAGLSYARNRGISAATGEIVVTTDDDVSCPPEWIERLVAPFARADVMVVTGNVLPAELDGDAERLFEAYGGLSRGFKPVVADADWYSRGRRAVPTWKLGCTANAAFRRAIFADPEIGLMDEALGAGTPTGCSEDTYIFYRVLKAGHAIAYEPSAMVWHHHRQTLQALRHQIYSYSKGHVAYQLTTWLQDGDRRGLIRIFYELPRTYTRRIWMRLRRRSEYPLTFIALEMLGCLSGPFALWRSRKRVRRLGKSGRLPERSTYGLHVESPRAEVTEA
jgi:glycosyltransferase involved in cell wall biosynthesis